MKSGDVVFFRRARAGLTSAPKDAFVEFQGHSYGILLGHVPREIEQPPPLPFVLRQMGEIGFISFDDIIQLAGKETGELIAKKFGEKYYGEKAQVIVNPLFDTEAKTPALTVVQNLPTGLGGES